MYKNLVTEDAEETFPQDVELLYDAADRLPEGGARVCQDARGHYTVVYYTPYDAELAPRQCRRIREFARFVDTINLTVRDDDEFDPEPLAGDDDPRVPSIEEQFELEAGDDRDTLADVEPDA